MAFPASMEFLICCVILFLCENIFFLYTLDAKKSDHDDFESLSQLHHVLLCCQKAQLNKLCNI